MPTGIYVHRHMIGSSNPQWKGGIPKCQDCGKPVSFYKAKRCKECWDKIRNGKNNPAWKGDKVKYRALHMWVVQNLGNPDTCEICKKSGFRSRQIHWANKDHKYKRNLKDWMRLCISCHGNYDVERGLRRRKIDFTDVV